MSELFDDEDKVLIVEDDLVENEKIIVEDSPQILIDARRRLEALMEAKRLRDELEDFPDA